MQDVRTSTRDDVYMHIIYSGGEVSSHRTILMAAGIKSIGINYFLLKKRGLPKKPWIISERLPDDVGVYVTAGLYDQNLSPTEFTDLADEYLAFLEKNAGRLNAAEEPDSPVPSGKQTHDLRMAMVDLLGEDCVWPVYHDGMNLRGLADAYPHVALPGSVIESDTSLAGLVRALSSVNGTTWHAVAHARPDNLRSLPVETVSTLAWLAPMLRGETVVWDGTKLVRYPQRMKDQARRRLSAVCDRAGLDFAKIQADDNKELAMLALWSYQRLEESMRGNVVVDNSVVEDDDLEEENDPGTSANKAVSMRKPSNVVPFPRTAQTPLPVLDFAEKTVVDYEDGRQVFRTVPVVQSRSHSIRQCDTCFVAASCPAQTAGSVCAFNLPVEVKTKDQLLGLLQAMIEMQAQRAAFGRYVEELNGGYLDPNVSQEMDRLFRMVKNLKDIQTDTEYVKITAERKTGAGVLSAIFGEKLSAPALPGGGLSEDQTTRLISQTVEGKAA